MIEQVLRAMITYYSGDPRRVNHFLKVYGFAKAIGAGEGLDARTQTVLDVAALTHDIGIKNSEAKFGSSSGEHQQIEGPPEAQKLLRTLGVDEEITRRVCFLIAHHHTYSQVDGPDYQILIEADFLVNAFEDSMSENAIRAFQRKVFRTKTGEELLHALYGV
ncbi:MAG TPA: HD domain-containing protein [Candidatus Limiplasma sp.]|nr:HD domain-containing protein [Candidatus Limiplasma sp.]HRX08803.1 HD domain-containing protein [Candidatus Limiplasma sp.]